MFHLHQNEDYIFYILKHCNLQTVGSILLTSVSHSKCDRNTLWIELIQRDHRGMEIYKTNEVIKSRTKKELYFYLIDIKYFDDAVKRKKIHGDKNIRVINPYFLPENNISLHHNNIREIPENWLSNTQVDEIYLANNLIPFEQKRKFRKVHPHTRVLF